MDITWILTLKLVPTSLNVKQPHNELSILECPKNLNIWLVLSQLINNLVFCVPNHLITINTNKYLQNLQFFGTPFALYKPTL